MDLDHTGLPLADRRSVRNILKKIKLRGFHFFGVLINTFDFSNCESACDLTEISAKRYDRKFESIDNILRPLSLAHFSQMSKRANLETAGTNAYETVGKGRVNKNFPTLVG